MLIFTDPPMPPKVYGLYTRENVDMYGKLIIIINTPFTIIADIETVR